MMLLYANREEITTDPSKIKYGEQFSTVMESMKEMIASAVCGTFDAKSADKLGAKGKECIVSLEAEGAFTLVVSNIEDNNRCHRRLLEATDNKECAIRYFHPSFSGAFYNTRVIAKVYYVPGAVRFTDPEKTLAMPTEEERAIAERYAISHNCTEAEAADMLSESLHEVTTSDSFNADTIIRSLAHSFRTDWD